MILHTDRIKCQILELKNSKGEAITVKQHHKCNQLGMGYFTRKLHSRQVKMMNLTRNKISAYHQRNEHKDGTKKSSVREYKPDMVDSNIQPWVRVI